MSNPVNGIKDYYNATAKEWADDWYPNEMMLPLLTKFIGLFPAPPRVLDAGCGAGYESMRLASLGADVVGIDISDESINIARDKNPNCRFEVMDCRDLSHTLGDFDGIVSIALIVHIEDGGLQAVFNNFFKVTKSGSFLLVAFVNGNGFSEERSYIEVNGEKYNRAFYLHEVSRITDIAIKSGFDYYDEWYLKESYGNWKFIVYRSKQRRKH